MILRPLSTTLRLASFPISGGERGVARERDEKKEDGTGQRRIRRRRTTQEEEEDHSLVDLKAHLR